MTPALPDTVAPVAFGSARLLAGVSGGVSNELVRHRSVHGPPRPRDLATLVSEAAAVRLLGRGGAGFPVSTKLVATPPGERTEVVVNGSESEPLSRKDRTLMVLTPHLVLDGAVTVARALGTRRVTVAVHDRESAVSLRNAVADRQRVEDEPEQIRVRHQPARFVSGEIRAVLEGLEGRPAVPPGRRALPSQRGLRGAPTFASNAETFAQLALLVSLGVARYAEVGAPEEPGTTLLTLAGDVAHGGVVEVPTGLPLTALTGAGAGPLLVGGYHGRWLDAPGDLVLSRPSLRERGLPLNAGVVARFPAGTCCLAEVVAVSTWLADQSAGQCGPCLFGVAAVARGVVDLLHGRAAPQVAHRLAGLAGRGACAHPDGTAAFVGTALTVLADEVDLHQRRGACGRPYLGVLPVRDGSSR